MSEVLDVIDQAQRQCELNLEAQLANAYKPVRSYLCECCGVGIDKTAKIKRWCAECYEVR